MKKIILTIKKEECKDSCPLPLEMIPLIDKDIKKIKYDPKTERAEIFYDTLGEDGVIKKLVKFGYNVRK